MMHVLGLTECMLVCKNFKFIVAEKSINSIQRVLVWSSWLRLAHWLMAIAVLLLAASGWLIKMSPSLANVASDYHYIIAALLIGSLVLRVGLLLFDKGTGNWQKLLPEAKERQSYKQILLFYLSFGKMPISIWYAHNPLWKPAYLLIFIVLFLQILTGMNRDAYPIMLGLYLPGVHDFVASIVVGFTVLHMMAVVLHDCKGTASDISAMINGHKIFVVQKHEGIESPAVHSISLDQLKKNQ